MLADEKKRIQRLAVAQNEEISENSSADFCRKLRKSAFPSHSVLLTLFLCTADIDELLATLEGRIASVPSLRMNADSEIKEVGRHFAKLPIKMRGVCFMNEQLKLHVERLILYQQAEIVKLNQGCVSQLN